MFNVYINGLTDRQTNKSCGKVFNLIYGYRNILHVYIPVYFKKFSFLFSYLAENPWPTQAVRKPAVGASSEGR